MTSENGNFDSFSFFFIFKHLSKSFRSHCLRFLYSDHFRTGLYGENPNVGAKKINTYYIMSFEDIIILVEIYKFLPEIPNYLFPGFWVGKAVAFFSDTVSEEMIASGYLVLQAFFVFFCQQCLKWVIKLKIDAQTENYRRRFSLGRNLIHNSTQSNTLNGSHPPLSILAAALVYVWENWQIVVALVVLVVPILALITVVVNIPMCLFFPGILQRVYGKISAGEMDHASLVGIVLLSGARLMNYYFKEKEASDEAKYEFSEARRAFWKSQSSALPLNATRTREGATDNAPNLDPA